jgi:hypothetical protein
VCLSPSAGVHNYPAIAAPGTDDIEQPIIANHYKDHSYRELPTLLSRF